MENCDITIDELCVLLAAEGIEAKRSTLGDFLLAQGLSRKKRQPTPPSRSDLTSRRREPLRAQRATWADCRRLVFLDERPGRGRTWPGVMAGYRAANGWWLAIPHGHWKTTTFIAALRLTDRITAPCVFDGPINGCKLPCLGPASPGPDPVRVGDIVIMDNQSPPTRSPAYTRPLRRSAQPRSTCRPTAPISIPSNRSSPSSKPFSARSAPEPSMTSGGQLETPSMNSLQPNAETTSSMQDIPSKPDVL